MADCACCGKARKPSEGAHNWCGACAARWYNADRPDTGPPPPKFTYRGGGERHAMRVAEYARLRAAGLSYSQAAVRLGVTPRAVGRYAAELGRPPVPGTVTPIRRRDLKASDSGYSPARGTARLDVAS